MYRKTFKNLTLSVAIYMSAGPLVAQDRCEADLQRVEVQNCLSRDRQTQSYSWKLTDQAYSLTANTCILDNSQNGTHRDIVIAIDRSNSNLIPDKQRKKLRADGISAAIDLINKLNDTYKDKTDQAPNLSVAMFSSDPNCREYQGGKISFVNDYPCVYTTAHRVTDEQHRALMIELLTETDGKYSSTGSTASDLSIPAQLLRDGRVLANEGRQAGMIMFTTGLSYTGTNGDIYSYLKSENYESSYSTALASYSDAQVKRVKLGIFSAPLTSPYYGTENRDAFENMCATADHPAADCQAVSTDPTSWLVNKIDIAQKLGSVSALSSGFVKESSEGDISTFAADQMLVTGQANIIPEKIVYLLDGQQLDQAQLSGEQVTINNIPAGGAHSVRLEVYANGEMIPFTLDLNTEVIPGADQDFTDKEMFCKAEPQVAAGISLKDLQGGSGSCGTISGSTENSRWTMLLFLLPLIVISVFSKARAVFSSIVLLSLAILPTKGYSAEHQEGGLNSQHYRPVVGGVGNTESGTVMTAGTFNAGLYGDYANDPVEIGGEKGKRIKGVTDDMVTAHFTGNIGLFSHVALGVHVPYVHKTDVEREVDGDDVEGGSLGQPADSAVFLKIGIVNKSKWALALMPYATIPTGNEEYLIGDGTSNYGGSFALSGVSGSFKWASNFGYMYRKKPLVLSDDRTNELKVTGYGLLSLGTEYRVNRLLSLGGNIFGKFHSGEKIDFTRTNPAEWQFLGKLDLTQSLQADAGFGTGIGKGYGSPDYRVVAGMTYIPTVSKAPVRRTVAKKK